MNIAFISTVITVTLIMLMFILAPVILIAIALVAAAAGAAGMLRRENYADGGLEPEEGPMPPPIELFLPAEREEFKTRVPFARKLTDHKRTLQYREKTGCARINLHLGQRKLFMTEVEFLTLHGDLSDTAVYVGSAPGNHLPYLLELFPNHKLILYDKTKHIPSLYKHPRVTVHERYFDDAEAKKYAGKGVFLISDIRRIPGSLEDLTDELVGGDMTMQAGWHKILKPAMTMLKFRPPYADVKFKYLDGDIYIQPWAPVHSTETRLMSPPDAPQVEYDAEEHNNKMFRFNVVSRQQYYEYDPRIKVEGMDHCYDCRAEIHIIGEYLKKFKPDLTEDQHYAELSKISNRLSREIRQSLNVGAHGKDKDNKDSFARLLKLLPIYNACYRERGMIKQ